MCPDASPTSRFLIFTAQQSSNQKPTPFTIVERIVPFIAVFACLRDVADRMSYVLEEINKEGPTNTNSTKCVVDVKTDVEPAEQDVLVASKHVSKGCAVAMLCLSRNATNVVMMLFSHVAMMEEYEFYSPRATEPRAASHGVPKSLSVRPGGSNASTSSHLGKHSAVQHHMNLVQAPTHEEIAKIVQNICVINEMYGAVICDACESTCHLQFNSEPISRDTTQVQQSIEKKVQSSDGNNNQQKMSSVTDALLNLLSQNGIKLECNQENDMREDEEDAEWEMWEDSKTNKKWVTVTRYFFPDDFPERVCHPCAPESNELTNLKELQISCSKVPNHITFLKGLHKLALLNMERCPITLAFCIPLCWKFEVLPFLMQSSSL
ncbi:hypothetical protein Tco_1418309 [Tanacetum coccineum]